ncbi:MULTISPECIES: FtsW/RodA/SpoVE family cell cycle protein [Nocardiopsis]|uniref:Cell division protein n=1 Tax=Nocardiopsis sinuspersici TaxID=501010 RepID=A0A1V3C5L2_9ACTN|nr:MULTISPECIES: FtsW/RodA/SpoVE family cell cycle protein [Nocardiopsis]NYH52641.1 cell division protein FtsW (lipid II flippase) [Nocardiopsis sinuspersici]OOC56084.1 cell division protein [Nocardiopsis sinuspersici]
MSNTSAPEAPTALPPVKRRNAELVLILFAIGITMAGIALAGINLNGQIPAAMWTVGLTFAAMSAAAHVAMRFVAPYADPLILPCTLFLNGIGVAMIWRINAVEVEDVERAGVGMQLVWTAVGLAFCFLIIIFLKDPRVLQRYTYISGLVAIILLALPAIPGLGREVYGARLWIGIGPATMQPSEFAKIALVIFLASYLMSKRQVLQIVGKPIKVGRFTLIELPRARDLAPILVGWVLAIGMLVLLRDLGTSLLLFGTFLAMLYVATQRSSWVTIGLAMFAVGAFTAYLLFWHVQARVNIWFHAFDREVYDAVGGSAQLVQGLVAMAYGGLFGTGLGAGELYNTFAADSDLILATIGEELGVTGLLAILLVLGLLVERGMRIALAATGAFNKLLASGVAFLLAYQVFIVLGGLTRVIPLTGSTTPFMAAGGSALMASWIMMGILLRISDNARRPAPQAIQDEGATQVIQR